MEELKYNRVLLKISGEALLGGLNYGIDPKVTNNISSQIKEVVGLGVEVAVVVGGGISGEVLLPVQMAWIGPLLIILECWLPL